MSKCIFCKIINKNITANIIYEDDTLLAFYDIHPKAKVHFLIIPKMHLESMLEIAQEHRDLMGNLMVLANKLAVSLKLDGYKIQINTGVSGGQEVFHLHIHVLAN